MSSFVHLHNHSHYSLLDGATSVDALIDATIAQGLDAVALTDHGNMFGAPEFYLKCKAKNIKPIVGMEAYQSMGSRFERGEAGRRMGKYYHLILLAKNDEGYRNLIKLSSLGYQEGFYYKPRIDHEILKEYHKGLVCLSACMKGEVPQLLLHNHLDEARVAVDRYRALFGDDYYLELQDHGIEEQIIIRKRMIELAREMQVPMVATNDEHYITKEHAKSQEVMLCINSRKTLDDPNRMRFSAEEMYYKTPAEMEKLFSDVPEAIENTRKIADKIEFDWDMSTYHLPEFPVPEGETLNSYLKILSKKGLEERYAEITPSLTERMEYELGIIDQMGFPGYFLIVKDFIDYARKQDIPVGPGRGSAAGSLVSYCLGITNLDPIKYDLIFERFLNPERLSMPDIDIDFCYERREEIMQYVVKKYGKDKVAQIITFGSMKARAVIRDVGRVLNIDLGEIDRIAKLVPTGPKVKLKDALEDVPELKEMAKQKTGKIADLLMHARALEGLARHTSLHAAGVVISPKPLSDYLPIYKPPESKQESGGTGIATQYTMNYVEKIGLLKMDFLGLRTLTVLYHATKLLARRDIEIEIDEVPLDDQSTYDLFARGETVGCFQFESSGMREYLRKLKPTCLEDLIAMNALYRPGPMDLIDSFIARKHGREEVTYLHPILEPILEETYGIIVYQEQVIRIASDMGGFSLGEGDMLRRAMGKKKVKEMAAQRKNFVAGAQEKGVSEKVAGEVFDHIDKFAGYGFNKSHAAAYAFVAYQTAFLKANYAAEFMASLLTSEMSTTDRIQTLVEEARHTGLVILPPDINKSEWIFTVEKGKVRFGLGAVKNVGERAIGSIVASREEKGAFKTLFDVTCNADLRLANRKVMESLVEVGAMDSLEGNRRSQLEAVEMALAFGHEDQYRHLHGQTTFFGEGSAVEVHQPQLPAVEDFELIEKLNRERELLGFYVTGHPLNRYKEELRAFTSLGMAMVETAPDARNIWVGGLVSAIKEYTARGGKVMAFVTIEDFSGTGEVLIFAEQWAEFREIIQPDACIMIRGDLSRRDKTDTGKIICNQCMPMDKAWRSLKAKLHLRFDTGDVEMQQVEKIVEKISQSGGPSPVRIEVLGATGDRMLFQTRKYSVKQSKGLLGDIRKLIGENNAWYKA